MEDVKRAYEKLYEAFDVWKYGSVADSIDPLGLFLSDPEAIYPDPFGVNPIPVNDLIQNGQSIGDRTPEEMVLIKECNDELQAALARLPRSERARLTFEQGLRPGAPFNPANHVDVTDAVAFTDSEVAPGIARVLWRGILGHTKSYVMCEYDVTPAVKAFYELVMAAHLPRSLKKFIFHPSCQVLLVNINTGPRIRTGLFRARPSVTRMLTSLVFDRADLHEVTHQIVRAWLKFEGKEQRAILESKYGKTRYGAKPPVQLVERGAGSEWEGRLRSGPRVMAQPPSSSSSSSSTKANVEEIDDEELEDAEMEEDERRLLQRRRQTPQQSKEQDLAEANAFIATLPAYLRGASFVPHAGYDELYVIVELAALFKSCVTPTDIRFGYDEATGDRICGGFGMPKRWAGLNKEKKDDIYFAPTTDRGFIWGMYDRPLREHTVKSGLCIPSGTCAEMMAYVHANAHPFIYRVDMSACHLLGLADIEVLVMTIRKMCPCVRHLICRLGVMINVIPPCLAHWPTLIVNDLSPSPGLICGAISLLADSMGPMDTYHKGVVEHRRGPPPFILDMYQNGLFLFGRQIRLIARSVFGGRIQPRHLLKMYHNVDLLTLDDGPIIQAMGTYQERRFLITVFGNYDELPSLVPICVERRSRACDWCRVAYRIAHVSSVSESYEHMGCMVTCPRFVNLPDSGDAEAGKFVPAEESMCCPECAERLGEFGKFYFPLCVSTCRNRRLKIHRPCGGCMNCELASCESDVFVIEVRLADPSWKKLFAREVMILYRLRGEQIGMAVIIDDMGVGPQVDADACAFIALLVGTRVCKFLSATALLASDQPGFDSSGPHPHGKQRIGGDGYYKLGSEVMERRGLPVGKHAHTMKDSAISLGDPQSALIALWILNFVFSQRNVTGMGVHLLADLCHLCPYVENILDKKVVFIKFLRALDRMGLIRIVHRFVFISIRHYAMFVNLMMTNPMDVFQSPVTHDRVLSFVSRSAWLDGRNAFEIACGLLLDFIRASAESTPEGKMDKLIILLQVARKAALSKRLDP